VILASVESSGGVRVAMHHLSGASAGARAGGPDRPALLVAHATGFHGRCYAPVASALGEHHDVWAFDARGHGATPPPDRPIVDWEGFADDALAAARALPAPLVGFGHSMGGAALLMAALREPERFSLLVLFEPIVFPAALGGDSSNPLADGARRRRPEFATAAAALTNFASKPPMRSFDPAALRAYVDGGVAPLDPDDPDGPVRLTCTPEFEAATFTAATAGDRWSLLSAVNVPVVVAGGSTAGPDPAAEIAAEIAGALPRGRFEGHPELDHFGPFTEPAAVARIIDDAVARQRSGSL
jgi:pimeloyl-ACP methyl ester carboxylesterase